MKIILISGFLGAGKTTFLQSLAKQLPDFCILENDYSHAEVDKKILSFMKKDIYSLEDGCICCSKKSDFSDSVLTISGAIDPPYLIIEPTGLGYLSKIIENIRPIQYERIELLSPITIVDYYTMDKTIKKYGELFWDQIKNAGHILLSKIENINNYNLEKAIEKIEPQTKAIVYREHYSTFSGEKWQQLYSMPYNDNCFISSSGKNISMETLIYKNVSFKDFHTLGTALNAISANRFGKVVRGKGMCKVASYTAKIDISQGSCDVSPVDDMENTELVFIGENLDNNAFSILLNQN